MSSSRISVRLAAEIFDNIAETACKRWSARSLAVVRGILVDGGSLHQAAVDAGMSDQQANILRGRFLAKLRAYRIEQFKKQIPPPSLERLAFYRDDIRVLAADGYSAEQIAVYLQQLGETVDPEHISSFLKEKN